MKIGIQQDEIYAPELSEQMNELNETFNEI
jgi:hypothetical protein